MTLLFYFFSNLLIISSFMVIVTQNTLFSALFLVLSFISASILLFLLECEFIPLMFIIIYIGAIAILFLFIIMMLDIKKTFYNKDFLKYFPFGSIIGLVFLIEIFLVVLKNFKSNPYENSFLFNFYTNWYDKIDSLIDTVVIGQTLYTYYALQFLIVGNVLLLAVLGVVVLTINTNLQLNKQLSFKQVSRNYRNAIKN